MKSSQLLHNSFSTNKRIFVVMVGCSMFVVFVHYKNGHVHHLFPHLGGTNRCCAHQYLTLEFFPEQGQMEAVFDEIQNGITHSNFLDEEKFLLVKTAMLHEMKHYFDCFGTVAGYSIFATYSDLLTDFVDVLAFMETNEIKWKLPVFNWIKEDKCPPIVKSFIKKANNLNIVTKKFLNPFEPFYKEGYREEYVVSIPNKWFGEAMAFPSKVSYMEIEEFDGDGVFLPEDSKLFNLHIPKKPLHYTRFEPLGLGAAPF